MNDMVWIIFGFIGQFIFGLRFIIQWIYSEIKKKSVIPFSFWYLSLFGTIMLLIYSIHKKDIVFIAGFSLNIIIYIRNLMLIYGNKKVES